MVNTYIYWYLRYNRLCRAHASIEWSNDYVDRAQFERRMDGAFRLLAKARADLYRRGAPVWVTHHDGYMYTF